MVNISVIIICRNEEKYIEKTLHALELQTFKPREVVIVDDASTDNTFNIIKEISQKNGWIIFQRKNNDERYFSIVNSMKIATTLLKEEFDYLMVLDADTTLEYEYLEKIIQRFETNPYLGISGGALKTHDEKILFESDPKVVFGSNRVYSKQCWNEINGDKIMNVNSFAWDPEHSVRATIRGYEVKRFDDITSYSERNPSLKVSSFTKGILRYKFGYSFTITFISSIFNLDLKFLDGFIMAWINKEKKIDNDKNMKKIMRQNDIKYIKKQYYRLISK